jgi:hypothetical protein
MADTCTLGLVLLPCLLRLCYIAQSARAQCLTDCESQSICSASHLADPVSSGCLVLGKSDADGCVDTN